MASKKFSDKSPEEEVSVHYLPFKIEYEGPAQVSPLFSNAVKLHSEELPQVLKTHFRGRPLYGKKLELPPDYTAFVATTEGEDKRVATLLEEHNNEEDTPTNNQTQLTHKFQTMTYWEWDKTPSSMDTVVKLQDWLQLAQVIHAPVGE